MRDRSVSDERMTCDGTNVPGGTRSGEYSGCENGAIAKRDCVTDSFLAESYRGVTVPEALPFTDAHLDKMIRHHWKIKLKQTDVRFRCNRVKVPILLLPSAMFDLGCTYSNHGQQVMRISTT